MITALRRLQNDGVPVGYLRGAGGAPKKLSGVSGGTQGRMQIFSQIGTVGVLKNVTVWLSLTVLLSTTNWPSRTL